MRLGVVYDIPPEPWRPERTRFVDAGPVRIGIEHREINNETLRESFSGDAKHAAALEQLLEGQDVNDGGVSLHVCGSDDGHEYLRFDCFETDPHYHYNHRVSPGAAVVNRIVMFDRAACGDMLTWALERIRAQLAPMLELAGGGHLAGRLRETALNKALAEIEQLIPRRS